MKNKRNVGCLVGVIALGVGAICLVTGGFWVGIQEYKDLPRLVSGIDFGAYSPDVYSYSPEQAGIISEKGYPRSFSILFYHDEDPDGRKVYVRHENWFYPDLGTSLTFENGLMVGEESMEPYAPVPTEYEPAMFTAFMNRESLATAAGIEEWFILPVEEELLVDADLYYADGLTFGLQSGDLVYLEAVGFEDPNAPAVVLPDESEAEETVSLTPEMEASLGLYDYSIILFQDGDVIDCGSMTAEMSFEADVLHLAEAGEAQDLTQIKDNIYTGEMDSVPYTLALTKTGYVWWAEEGGVFFEFYAIRELSDEVQMILMPDLSEEETLNQGTQTYRVDFCEDSEIWDTQEITLTNTFTGNSVEMVENAGPDIYVKLGTNFYMDDEESDFEMIFTDIGFIWRWWDDENRQFSFAVFTIE